jgi:hypothetical protein
MAERAIGQKAEIGLRRMRGVFLVRRRDRGIALLPDCATAIASAD